MASSDDDEDLKRAIALSLQDQEANPVAFDSPRNASSDQGPAESSKQTIDLTEDSPTESSAQTSSSVPLSTAASSIPTSSSNSSLWAAARARHEARASQKRDRSISPPPLRDPTRRPVKQAKATNSTSDFDDSRASAHGAPQQSPQATLRFSKPVIKRTWVHGFWNEKNCVKLEEILQKDELQLAVFSSYLWDLDWLFRKLDTKKTKIVLVVQAKDQETKDEYETFISGVPNLRLAYPPMDGQVNCMHSKLMLLGFQNYLRIVVPTANLMTFDWGETGVMENSVFLVDLPRLPEGQSTRPEDMTLFGKELLHFMRASRLEQHAEQMLKFDFSATKDLAFVHTIGGSHYGEDLQRTGFPGLSRAINQLNLTTTPSLEIDYLSSSLGSLNKPFIEEIHKACRGSISIQTPSQGPKKDASQFFKPRAAQTSSQKGVAMPPADIEKQVRVQFPTDETVRHSKGKTDSAGTICLWSKWYNSPNFPRILRDYQSTRNGVLSHNKIILARGLQSHESGALRPVVWAYVGSANLSESAWGKVVTDRSRKEPKLNCRNWECGVLMPIPLSAEQGEDIPPVTAFESILDLPCQIPGDKYDGRKPWFFQD